MKSRVFVAIFQVALFCLTSMAQRSYGNAFIDGCAARLGILQRVDFKIVENPAIESAGPLNILSIDEPDAKNQVWIASLAQSFETHLDINSSLEYVPHSLVADVHSYLDQNLAARESAFLELVKSGKVSARTAKRVLESFSKLKADSEGLKTQLIRQADFLYFSQNVTRVFASIDKDGRLTPKGERYTDGILNNLYQQHYETDYFAWRKLSRESLLIPTEKSLSIEDFNLSNPYPIYYFGVSNNGGVADGNHLDAEEFFIHDLIHNRNSNSRFQEIHRTITWEAFSKRLDPREKLLLQAKIAERVLLLKYTYQIGSKKAPTLRQKRILALAFFSAFHEDTPLSTFSSREDNLAKIAKSLNKRRSYDFKLYLIVRLERTNDLGFYFQEKIVTISELTQAFEILQEALKLTIEAQKNNLRP